MQHFIKDKEHKIGAVGGLVLNPNAIMPLPEHASAKIEDFYNSFNIQLGLHKTLEPKSVDHLHSSFVYRTKASSPYETNMSKTSFREDTLFSYTMKKNSYELLVDPELIIYHFQMQDGGCRSDSTRAQDIANDELIFKKKMEEFGIKFTNFKVIFIPHGLGDNVVMRNIIKDFMNKYNNYDKIIIGTSFKDAAWQDIDKEYNNIQVLSVQEAATILMQNRIDPSSLSIYNFMGKNNWKESMEEAYRKLYDF